MKEEKENLLRSAVNSGEILVDDEDEILTQRSPISAATASLLQPSISRSSSTANLNASVTNSPPKILPGSNLNAKPRAIRKDYDPLSHDFTKLFNMRNAKFIAIFLVTLCVLYHGSLNSFYGRNSCNRLLGEGHLLGDNEWQPYGCMIHKYTKTDIKMCFKYVKYFNGKNKFVFIGDMRIRQVYFSFINKLDKEFKAAQLKSDLVDSSIQEYLYKGTHNQTLNFSLNYSDKMLNLDASFIWKPVLDETVNNLIESYLQPTSQKPNFIVIGTAIPYFNYNSSKKALDWFKSNLTNLIDTVKSLNFDHKYPTPRYDKEKSMINKKLAQEVSATVFSSSSVSSTTENNNSKAYIDPFRHESASFPSIYWMLQDPLDESKFNFNKSSPDTKITNRKIDTFNREAINLLYHTPVNIWSSGRLVSQAYNRDSSDGMQIGPFALEIDSQILYNLHCNNRMNFDDASCCSQPEEISLVQQVLFALCLVCLLATLVLTVYRNSCQSYSNFRVNISGKEIGLTTSCKTAASSSLFYKFLKAVSKLALVMLYFFACDRANFFMKENKHYTLLTFLIPLIYIFVVGLFFHDTLPMAKVMNRQQTYEVRGVMQVIILLYMMSNAQQSTPLYLLVRLFTSTYLFLSGYGHFMYYWNSPNYSVTRFFEILFRLNFLSVTLCFTMNRMYQFYSFVPLVTFWLICTYILMMMYPRVSAKSAKDNYYHYFYMIAKLATLLGLITALNLSEVLFERIFIARPWKFLFVSSDDLINEWRVHWSRDCYSFAFGMCFALVFSILKRLNLIEDIENVFNYQSNSGSNSPNLITSANAGMSQETNLINNSNNNSAETIESMEFSDNRRKTKSILNIKIKFIMVFIAFFGVLFYFIFSVQCNTTREACDVLTPYLTIIPIASFFVLRNSLQVLREKCSFMFIWFGRISLELYICSFHVWSAADLNGMLVMLPGYPVVNILLTTFIFVCVAHELNVITKELCEIIVPRDNWRVCLRNLVAFVILLTPVAIKYGYI